MAKSKLVKANKRISENLTSCFQKITDSVMGRYTNIEDKFVDLYLTKDGETVEEAKKRLKEKEETLFKK